MKSEICFGVCFASIYLYFRINEKNKTASEYKKKRSVILDDIS